MLSPHNPIFGLIGEKVGGNLPPRVMVPKLRIIP
jgi:hypothetical protein